MNFEESNTIQLKKINNIFIYFLIENNIVVYVGQTRKGLFRPLSHKNKKYDTIEILYCNENELDMLEDKFIVKYNPKYNKTYNTNINYNLIRCKTKLNKYFGNNYNGKKITLRFLKKIIKELNIIDFSENEKLYIKIYDYEKILSFLIENEGKK